MNCGWEQTSAGLERVLGKSVQQARVAKVSNPTCMPLSIMAAHAEKHISTKKCSTFGHTVKEAMTEVKMAVILKRSELVNQKKSYHQTDRECFGVGVRKNGRASVGS